MTRKALATVVVAMLLVVVGCTRSSGSSTATPDQVYAAGPTTDDIRSTLASETWWPTTPSFSIRPLGLPSMPENVKFGIGQHFVHLGTGEQLLIEYSVFSSSSTATTQFTNIQNSVSSGTGPKAGDQSIYWGTKSPSATDLYDTFALIRQGPVLIEILITNSQGFLSINLIGKLAQKLVSRLKSALSGKIKPSPLPQSDQALLLPLGTDVTLVGAVRLPIEVAAELLGATSPQDVVDSFSARGVKDFLYGDYALNADLNMEVRAIVFDYSSPADATSWIDLAIGKSNLDASGVASGYSSSNGEYFAFILAGSRVGLLFCDSISPFSSASRACETPMASLIGAWQTRLEA